jgi:hypothetical protein
MVWALAIHIMLLSHAHASRNEAYTHRYTHTRTIHTGPITAHRAVTQRNGGSGPSGTHQQLYKVIRVICAGSILVPTHYGCSIVHLPRRTRLVYVLKHYHFRMTIHCSNDVNESLRCVLNACTAQNNQQYRDIGDDTRSEVQHHGKIQSECTLSPKTSATPCNESPHAFCDASLQSDRL